MTQYDIELQRCAEETNPEGLVRVIRAFQHELNLDPQNPALQLNDPTKARGASLAQALSTAVRNNQYGMIVLLFDKDRAQHVLNNPDSPNPEGLETLQKLLAVENDTGSVSAHLKDFLAAPSNGDFGVDDNQLKSVIKKIDQDITAHAQNVDLTLRMDKIQEKRGLNEAGPAPTLKI